MTVTFRVFKKGSADGRITVYLGRREYVDHVNCSDPIDGVIYLDKNFLNDKRIVVQLICAFRYGREQDETMGLSFKKELTLGEVQVFPENNKIGEQPTRLQERLLSKMGKNSYPFHLNFPLHSPTSVILSMGPGDSGEPCGVEYFVRAQIISTAERDVTSTVNMGVRKIQYAPTKPGRQPCTVVRKDFALSPGDLELEATLDKQLYHHGDDVKVNISVKNNSAKTVKKIIVTMIQTIDVAMFTGGHHTARIARIETNEGCPVVPGSTMQKQFFMRPTPRATGRYGVALDGNPRSENQSLASSTLLADENNKDIFGLVISYSVKVKLVLGAIGGDLTAELPFVLMHPKPDMRKMLKADTLSMDQSYAADENQNGGLRSTDLMMAENLQEHLQMEPLRRRK